MDLVGVGFEWLMCGQYVVIGGDDFDIVGCGGGQRGFVIVYCGIGMGLIVAGQMRLVWFFGGGVRYCV